MTAADRWSPSHVTYRVIRLLLQTTAISSRALFQPSLRVNSVLRVCVHRRL